MDEKLIKVSEIGMDLEESLYRYGGSESLLLKHVLKFSDYQDKFDAIEQSFKNNETEELLTQLHPLKGVTSNMGLSEFYRLIIKMETDLKETQKASEEDLNEFLSLFNKLREIVAGLEG